MMPCSCRVTLENLLEHSAWKLYNLKGRVLWCGLQIIYKPILHIKCANNALPFVCISFQCRELLEIIHHIPL